MAYKTILVHVDGSAHAAERVQLAGAVATKWNGHVIGAAMTGVSRYLFESMAVAGSPEVFMPQVEDELDRLREKAKSELDQFDEKMRSLGGISFERRLVEDENIGGLTLQAKYADIVILSQFDPDSPNGGMHAALPETVAIVGGRPVLVIPYIPDTNPLGGNVMLAWDGSVEATRAVHHALPLLQSARKTQVAVFNAGMNEGEHGAEPGADVALYLARHGVNVDVVQVTTSVDIGDALISLCADAETDLLVMGCYGHSRFREIMLGGVTRTVLSSMTVPVFMVH